MVELQFGEVILWRGMQMSYPNKEKSVDKKSETVESPGQDTKQKSSPPENIEEPRLPVGKLKWSKDEEEEQDTELSLAKSNKNEAVSSKGEDGNESSETVAGETELSQKPSLKEDATPPSNPEEETSLSKEGDAPPVATSEQEVASSSAAIPQTEKRELTIEDTLTPIDFKEYSIDPNLIKSEEQEQFETELKKPAFQVESLPKKEEQSVRDKSFGQDAEEGKSSSRGLIRTAKILWFPITIVVVLIVGFIIGHTVIGDQPAGDIFNIGMWEHIYDLLFTK
jgi:hypothetical protein